MHCVDLGESFFLNLLFETDSYSNEYLLTKFGFDTAENEPCKVCPLSAYRSPSLALGITLAKKKRRCLLPDFECLDSVAELCSCQLRHAKARWEDAKLGKAKKGAENFPFPVSPLEQRDA